MAKKITAEMALKKVDLISWEDSEEGFVVCELISFDSNTEMGLQLCLWKLPITEIPNSPQEELKIYKANLIEKKAELITVSDLVQKINILEKQLEMSVRVVEIYEKEAIDRSRREDSSGGKFS